MAPFSNIRLPSVCLMASLPASRPPPCLMVRPLPLMGGSSRFHLRVAAVRPLPRMYERGAPTLPPFVQKTIESTVIENEDRLQLTAVFQDQVADREQALWEKEDLLQELDSKVTAVQRLRSQAVTEILRLKRLLHMQGLLKFFSDRIVVLDCPNYIEATLDERYLYALDSFVFWNVGQDTLRERLSAETTWKDADMVTRMKRLYWKLSGMSHRMVNGRTHVEIVEDADLTHDEVSALVCIAESLHVQYRVRYRESGPE